MSKRRVWVVRDVSRSPTQYLFLNSNTRQSSWQRDASRASHYGERSHAVNSMVRNFAPDKDLRVTAVHIGGRGRNQQNVEVDDDYHDEVWGTYG